jgi:hypothetical protein
LVTISGSTPPSIITENFEGASSSGSFPSSPVDGELHHSRYRYNSSALGLTLNSQELNIYSEGEWRPISTSPVVIDNYDIRGNGVPGLHPNSIYFSNFALDSDESDKFFRPFFTKDGLGTPIYPISNQNWSQKHLGYNTTDFPGDWLGDPAYIFGETDLSCPAIIRVIPIGTYAATPTIRFTDPAELTTENEKIAPGYQVSVYNWTGAPPSADPQDIQISIKGYGSADHSNILNYTHVISPGSVAHIQFDGAAWHLKGINVLP